MDSSQSAYVVPSAGRYIASGFAADVYQINEHQVIKRPKSFPGCDSDNEFFRGLLDNERKVYERLGSHEGIIRYLGISDESTGAIILEFANDGDFSDYITARAKPSIAHRASMIRLLSNAWLHIYSRNVSAHDIKPDNVLIQNGVPKICDFTEGILFPLGDDMHSVCPKETLQVDLIGIGCVIYSVASWEVFYYDFFCGTTPADCG